MQAQSNYFTGSATRTLLNVVKNEGFLALYRGLLPPLIGSAIFRSVQFSVYGAMYTALKDSAAARTELPFTGGLKVQVIVAGVVASSARAAVESPLEFIKVRKQTGQAWMAGKDAKEALAHPLRELRNVYRGFTITWVRTVGLMTNFFIMVDYLERQQQALLQLPIIGPFIKGGVCATAAWVLVWPFENVSGGSDWAAGQQRQQLAARRRTYSLRGPGQSLAAFTASPLLAPCRSKTRCRPMRRGCRRTPPGWSARATCSSTAAAWPACTAASARG
jgi:solute carrier family 25 carnitine/acylcarnitine transporter 20/29